MFQIEQLGDDWVETAMLLQLMWLIQMKTRESKERNTVVPLQVVEKNDKDLRKMMKSSRI